MIARLNVRFLLFIALLGLICSYPVCADQPAGTSPEVQGILEHAVSVARDVPNPFFRAEILDGIASAYAEAHNITRALEIARRKDNPAQDNTVLRIIRTLLKQGEVIQARQLASRMPNDYWKVNALEEIGLQYLSNGKKQLALGVFREALPAGHATSQEFVRVRKVLPIAEGLSRAGDDAKAEEIITDFLATASSLPDPEEKDRLFGDAAELLAKLGDVAGALRLINAMRDDIQMAAMANVIGVMARSGDIQQALDLLVKLKSQGWHDAALGRIAEAQLEKGDINGALTTVTKLPQISVDKVVALSRIADKWIDRHNDAAALRLIDQAAHAARELTDLHDRARHLGSIARRLAEAHDIPKAMSTIRLALQTIDQIGEQKERNSPLLTVAEAQATIGDFAGALKSVTRMTSDWHKDRANFQIAKARAWSGDVHGALQFPAPNHDPDFIWQGLTLRRIARIQAYKGDLYGALQWAMTQVRPSDRALALLGMAEGLLLEGRPLNNDPKSFLF